MEFLLKKNLAVCLIVSIVMSQSLTPTVALTTNNRILLSSVLVGSALAASISGGHVFSPTEYAALTTAVLFLTIPRPQAAQKGYCTSPGYSVHPLFGCFSLVQSTNPVTIAVARQECANEGGQLLLVKSEEERKELIKLLPSNKEAFIQGSKDGDNWVTDAGSPLPYVPTSGIVDGTNPQAAGIVLMKGGIFAAKTGQYTNNFYFCQI
ncbi:uncharacterized protein LOC128158041 [Crassostrea angulata]|uniref:uncharacterized protein LOC128158041 n=1 Tax=Magallana angulata TaxID=2784310 RepID=UPI0022B0A8DB|nr:uncharacterized protein LOC128158041 [Crassostrea angulata]